MSNSFYTLLFILFLSCSSKTDENFFNNNKKYWTNDIKEIEKVMSYILDYDAYKDISKLDKNKKI